MNHEAIIATPPPIPRRSIRTWNTATRCQSSIRRPTRRARRWPRARRAPRATSRQLTRQDTWRSCSPAAAAAAAAAHRLARQAGGAVRRQVPHHRLHAVQLRQLRHPPHRRRHAVQGAQPDPPHPARLELPRRALQRVRRAAAGPAAHRRGRGTRAPPTRCTRTSTSCAATTRSYVLILAGDHVYKMDYGTHARRPRRAAAPT